MSDTDASDSDKLKKELLSRYNYTEGGYRKRFREVPSLSVPETEETPDMFFIRRKNYLAKWLELSGSSPENFDALVDLIVKEQFTVVKVSDTGNQNVVQRLVPARIRGVRRQQ